MKYNTAIILISVFLLVGCGSSVENHSMQDLSKTNANSKMDAPPIERIKNVEGETPTAMVFIEGGKFKMGTDHGMPFESPVHEVTLDSYWIDKHEVTVAEFEKFVKETGYVTEGEKIGWSGVFSIEEGGWTRCDGVSWRNPDCGDKKPNLNEPITMVSWNDANAYAKWAGKRLPTEAEFECAARGSLDQNEYAWGNELRPNGKPVANWWQGNFPDKDTQEDGFNGRAPVMSFAPNVYGLYDVAGNVWEYCTNYRTAGRSHSPTDSALNNLGFRLVKDESK